MFSPHVRWLSRAALVFGLALAFAGLWTAEGAVTNQYTLLGYLSERGYEAVPLKWTDDNHLFVEGKINGRKAAFCVDTGAGFTTVDQSLAVGVKRVKKTAKKTYGVYGVAALEQQIVIIDKLEPGPVSLEKQPAEVANLHTFRETHLGSLIPANRSFKEPDVLLGLSFLRENHAIIDCRKPTLYLRRQEPDAALTGDIEQLLQASGFVSVSLLLTNGSLYTAGAINGHPATFLFDTGGGVTTIDAGQVDALGLGVLQQIGTSVDIAGRKKAMYLGTIQSLRLGDFVRDKLHVAIVDLGAWRKREEEKGVSSVQGILGPEVLTDGHAIIDCSSLKIFFYQAKQTPAPKP